MLVAMFYALCSSCSPNDLVTFRRQREDGDGDQSGGGAGDAHVQHQAQPAGGAAGGIVFEYGKHE